VQGFFEEFIWRGYLITATLFILGGSILLALLISSLAFASIHYYFGILGVLPHTINGFVFGIVFLLTNTIWAPTVSHLIYNFLAIRRIRKALKRVGP
jgi:membrane protease YdiL (CAAX protease family)